MDEVFREVLTSALFLSVGISFISAIIQGYSGFGGGLIIIPLLSIIYTPVEAITIAATAAIVGSFLTLRDALKNVEWREATPLTLGMATVIPIGLLFLTTADPALIRLGMGIFILIAALLMLSGWTYNGLRNYFTSAIAGILAGISTGAFGVPGGPFLVIYYMSSNSKPKVQRANIIITVAVAMWFLLGGLIANGAGTDQTIARTVILVPIFVLGTICGRFIFNAVPSTWFSKVINLLLIAIAITILLV
jgi:uncharacterized membrane protein YfcA